MSYNPNGDKTILLLHGNGTNGSTTITDSSIIPKSVSANGNAQISTTQSKYGGSSISFDGTGDYLSLSTGVEFNFSTFDFTIELWAYIVNYSTTRTILSKYTTWPSNLDLQWYINTSGIFTFVAGDSATISLANNSALPLTSWTHLAVCRSQGITRSFVGGITQTATHTGSVLIPNDKNVLRIGLDLDGTNGFNGYLDDIHISTYAKYTSDFTPPTAELEDPDPQILESVPQRKSIHFSTTYLASNHSNLITINR